MTIVRITLRKQLSDPRAIARMPGIDTFSTEYLVRTDAPWPSPQLEEYAKALTQAESRLYPPSVQFTGATVALATPGASADGPRGTSERTGREARASGRAARHERADGPRGTSERTGREARASGRAARHERADELAPPRRGVEIKPQEAQKGAGCLALRAGLNCPVVAGVSAEKWAH